MKRVEDRPDRDLIDAYLAGDQAGFAALYERYRRPLYSYLNRMLPGQTATVDDLFQQTWLKAINYLAKYQDQQTFFSWLARIAHNAAIDHFRRESQRPTSELDEDMQLPDESGIPWRKLGQTELAQAIAAAVAELPPDQREVFLLRQNDVPFKDIAAIQKSSLNTVLGRMHYAVTKLRHRLREWT